MFVQSAVEASMVAGSVPMGMKPLVGGGVPHVNDLAAILHRGNQDLLFTLRCRRREHAQKQDDDWQ